MDVDARIQLFDLKTKYQFQTKPGFDRYNMPLYSVQTQPGSQTISYYPVYQGFENPVYINGIQIPMYQDKSIFFNLFPNVVQNMVTVATGDGTSGPYSFTFPISPNNTTPVNVPMQYLLRGHIDMSGVIDFADYNAGAIEDPPLISAAQITANDYVDEVATTSVYPAVYITSNGSDGSSIVVQDSGMFLEGNENYGLLIQPGNYPNGNLPLTGGPTPNYSTTQNTINYLTGAVSNLYFPASIPSGVNINAQAFLFQCGLPRGVLYNNNTLTFRVPPDRQYLVEIDAYLTPAAYLSTTDSIKFAYMSEYIARGAARKILADTGDIEQFQFYEPLFKEQEMLVWKRSQRQFTATRTPTIYSSGPYFGGTGSYGGAII